MPTPDEQARDLRRLLTDHDLTIAAAERRLNLASGSLGIYIGLHRRRDPGPREVVRVHRACGLEIGMVDLFPAGVGDAVRMVAGDDPPLAEPYDLNQLGPDLVATGIVLADGADMDRLRGMGEVVEAARFGWGQVLIVVREILRGGE